MTAPAATLTVTQRYKLKDLKLERATVLPAGKVWLCRGRGILHTISVADLARTALIPDRCDTICLSAFDYDDVKQWIG